jgi:hypothetical protein
VGRFSFYACDVNRLNGKMAVFHQAKEIAAHLFQERADAIDQAYQARPAGITKDGKLCKWRVSSGSNWERWTIF